jgi:hypothetical protein
MAGTTPKGPAAPASAIGSIIKKISDRGILGTAELKALQTHIDLSEAVSRARESHHETTSHHHTKALNLSGILEQISRPGQK